MYISYVNVILSLLFFAQPKKGGNWPDGMFEMILRCCWQYYPEERSDFSKILETVGDLEKLHPEA